MQPTKQLPKEERKKGWHLPFPWLWNPTGSKLFEVLFREETVIASILKRGGKCHYTRITVAVTSAEKAKRAGSESECWPVCQEQSEKGLCVPATGGKLWVLGPRRYQEKAKSSISSHGVFQQLLDCSFFRFPLLFFPYSSNSPVKEEAESTQASCCKINEGVKLLSWITPKECNDSVSKMLLKRTVRSLCGSGWWLQH